jgi:hypothetical protein
MINDGRPDTNRTVLIKCVGENLLPTAQTWRLWRSFPPVAAPGTRASHAYLFCDLGPAQVLVTKLQDFLGGGGMSSRPAATHGDAGTHGSDVVTARRHVPDVINQRVYSGRFAVSRASP